ncbi:hypothetical protein PSJ8397_02054 [Pseudooctadecabacter jejudonensis]|uniref:Hydantoinase/oxoprolinase N-terminal domain-containing protein n=1 Tax=Pseudooctadecabacter jejudonensis TaxID=1391910 RepID=A0A1Y5SHX6_9RHOB|nr:hypothetical protein PSJ8397_02054 [Pseudooctadecabacter jejudonensis]
MTAVSVRMDVDIGGTFTDVVLENGSTQHSVKVLTTYEAPKNAIIDGMYQVCAKAGKAHPTKAKVSSASEAPSWARLPLGFCPPTKISIAAPKSITYFHRGQSICAIADVLDTDRKAITHIPHRGSAEAFAKKHRAVGQTMGTISDHVGREPGAGFGLVRRAGQDWKCRIIAATPSRYEVGTKSGNRCRNLSSDMM